MLKKILRTVFTIVGIVLGIGISQLVISVVTSDATFGWHISKEQEIIAGVLFGIIFGIIFFRLVPTFRRKGQIFARGIETELKAVPANDVIAATVGLIAGLIIAYLISQTYSQIDMPALVVVLNLITYIILGSFGMMIATRKSGDLFSAIANVKKAQVPGKGRGRAGDATPKILDTSVIIDGRIADIMKTGFLEGPIVIPEFVLVELRHIADSSDSLKRNRGRRGLDILNKIQTEYGIEIYNTDSEKELDEIPEVDVKLLKLAHIMGGKVVTNDYNLNKVAIIKEVPVLNINELANTLKPIVLPGENMEVFLVKEGKDSSQAVAYLDDGTMIVVEDGRKYIGKSIEIVVTSVLQTSAGRMIFGRTKKHHKQ